MRHESCGFNRFLTIFHTMLTPSIHWVHAISPQRLALMPGHAAANGWQMKSPLGVPLAWISCCVIVQVFFSIAPAPFLNC